MFLYKAKHGTRPESQGEEIAYWRKCNQIRNWFDTHLEGGVENCEFSPVSKDDIEHLIADCYQVLDHHRLAKELMPTRSGFFFGSTDYDEWYYSDLTYTVSTLLAALSKIDWDTEDVYYYEWW